MLELKMSDLRLRGRGFTLYPAAREQDLDDLCIDRLDRLIFSIYAQMEKSQEKDPFILDSIHIEDVDVWFPDVEFDLQLLINKGLITKENQNIILTEKTVRILERAAQIQKQLDDEGFSHCPCSLF